jgi:hypothetical protein
VILLLAIPLFAPLLQEPARDRVHQAVMTYASPRTKTEERTKIVEKLSAMGPAGVGFIQSVADGMSGGMQIPSRTMAADVKVDLLRRLGDERGAQAILLLRKAAMNLEAADRPIETVLDEIRRQGIGCIVLNSAEYDTLSKLRLTGSGSGEPVGYILDRMFQKHRLDYYARGSVLVVASRSWLWGPPSAGAPEAPVLARVTEALGQLESEMVDKRVAAERSIIDAGPGVLPILEKEATASKGVRRTRLAGLIDRVYARHTPDRLHPPFAEPGLLTEEAHDFLRSAAERPVSISFFKPLPLSEILARVAEFSETPIALDPALPASVSSRKLTLAVADASVQDVLEALVVPLGAAVRPEPGKFLIAPPK